MSIELMERALEFITGVYFGEHEGSSADREKLEADLTTAIQQEEAQQPATPEPVGHYTGRCAHCGSSNLWDDNLAYGCIPADGPSTYEQRFTDAVRAICGVTPPAELVSYWISNTERDDDLQQWVGSYATGWVQNIAVLDAAHVMATQPTEGGAHRTE